MEVEEEEEVEGEVLELKRIIIWKTASIVGVRVGVRVESVM